MVDSCGNYGLWRDLMAGDDLGKYAPMDLDEQRRSFVIEVVCAGCGDMDAYALVEMLHVIDEWLKTGIVPKRPVKHGKNKLEIVSQ